MKIILMCAALLLASAPAFAAKSCETLKTEIAAKLDAKKLSGYTLDVVAKDQAGGGKVIGSCDGGSKSIVYTKGAKAAKAAKSK